MGADVLWWGGWCRLIEHLGECRPEARVNRWFSWSSERIRAVVSCPGNQGACWCGVCAMPDFARGVDAREPRADRMRRMAPCARGSGTMPQSISSSLQRSRTSRPNTNARGDTPPMQTLSAKGGVRRSDYRRCLLKNATVRSQAIFALAASYRGVVSLLNPCWVSGYRCRSYGTFAAFNAAS